MREGCRGDLNSDGAACGGVGSLTPSQYGPGPTLLIKNGIPEVPELTRTVQPGHFRQAPFSRSFAPRAWRSPQGPATI